MMAIKQLEGAQGGQTCPPSGAVGNTRSDMIPRLKVGFMKVYENACRVYSLFQGGFYLFLVSKPEKKHCK